MTARVVPGTLAAALAFAAAASAQTPQAAAPIAVRYVDAADGLSLEQAIARARAQEPSLRAARSRIDLAEAMKRQSAIRPNPSVSFERRDEPGGTDTQTMVALEWPLDLFRRSARVALAGREVATAQFAAAEQERQLAAEVRTRYGAVLLAVRDLQILDELAAITRRQHELLRSRVEEGAAPPLERDLLQVELQRLEADRLLQSGRADAALLELKRVLGMPPDAALAVRDTLEDLVQGEASAPPPAPPAATPIEERPDVREASSRIDAAEAKIAQAEAEGRFDASVFASYVRMDAGFPQRGFAADGGLVRVRGLFQYVSAGARVTIPVFDRNQGGVAAARAERAGAAAAYEAARLAARTEVAAAQVRDERARGALRLYGAPIRSVARQNLAVVAQSHELGRVTVFDVLGEQRRYLEVERAYASALREAYDARTALELALGGVR
jgi:cobalt-zinc-cadmium efflux system outer membrane protein